MSKNDRQKIALAIARELQDMIPSPRISERAGVTIIESLPGKVEVTDDGVVVTTKRGVSAGWTHEESCSSEHSAMRCNLLLRSVS
jgi:hypothetical protein|uniref:Uncharacterized protein n=1 Tax=Siphoviridae sp. ctQ091 TaxID=2825490 RepID=A0A8S5NVL4_9CAUD|nr:MAG TPA: hypothetical protein [Siphoviridae sp. ctQ091]